MKLIVEGGNAQLTEIYLAELRVKIQEEFSENNLKVLEVSNTPEGEKGLWDQIFISILSKAAAEAFGKFLTFFSRKNKVNIIIEKQDGTKIKISYRGNRAEEVQRFLETAVE